MAALFQHVKSIHPALWRGAQLTRVHGRTVDTGYAALSAELPGGVWPLGALVELLVQQPGIGEMRLLKPALAELGARPIALLQAPHVPNSLAFAYLGVPVERLMRLRTPKTADALWSAERVLQARSCGALFLWQQHIRTEPLWIDAVETELVEFTAETFRLCRPFPGGAQISPYRPPATCLKKHPRRLAGPR